MDLHIVFTESAVLLSRKPYASWRQIQDEMVDYKASLGPMSPDEATVWLDEEYSYISPAASAQVGSFLSNSEDIVEITFRARPSRDPSMRRAELVVALLKAERALPIQIAIAVVLLGAIGLLRLWLGMPWWLVALAAALVSIGAIGNAVTVLYCRLALRRPREEQAPP